MSWVLSLARSGGTAGSHGGHETRRHRVRGPFPMGACLLLAGTLALAGCGSSSNSTVTFTQQQQPQPEPEPEPQTGGGTPPTDTTTTEDGDGDTDSGDTTSTDDGGQTSTQQPPQQPSNQQSPQTGGGSGGNQGSGNQGSGNQGSGGSGGGTGGGSSDRGIINNPPPNNPSVVSSLSRSSGRPEPKAIDNCGNVNTNTVVNCAPVAGQSSSISGTGYTVDYTVKNNWYSSSFVNLQGKDRDLEANLIGRTNNAAFNPSDANYNFRYIDTIESGKSIEVTYQKEDGFHGFYSYEAASGQITEDVTLKANFYRGVIYIDGYIGDNNGITMEGTNFGQIKFSTYTTSEDGQFIVDNGLHFSNLTTITNGHRTFNELKGSFKNDGSSTSFPTQVVGELKMKRFFDTSPIGNNKPLEYNENLYKRGDNALAGVFVADKTNEREKRIVPLEKNLEGNLGMFSYGIWASEKLIDNRIVFLKETTKFNPARTASDYTAHTYHTTASGIVEVIYKREDGFKGAYIYEGKTGELTGDVNLYVNFGGFGAVTAQGAILTDLEIGGYDLKGIAIGNGRIAANGNDNTHNTGVGGIDIDADGIDDSNTAAKFNFGDYRPDLNNIDRTTVSHHGLARKVRLVLSPDGIQTQGSTPETYPSQIAGEVEINQFKIKASDGDNNTILGVFVADKQE